MEQVAKRGGERAVSFQRSEWGWRVGEGGDGAPQLPQPFGRFCLQAQSPYDPVCESEKFRTISLRQGSPYGGPCGGWGQGVFAGPVHDPGDLGQLKVGQTVAEFYGF